MATPEREKNAASPKYRNAHVSDQSLRQVCARLLYVSTGKSYRTDVVLLPQTTNNEANIFSPLEPKVSALLNDITPHRIPNAQDKIQNYVT